MVLVLFSHRQAASLKAAHCQAAAAAGTPPLPAGPQTLLGATSLSHEQSLGHFQHVRSSRGSPLSLFLSLTVPVPSIPTGNNAALLELIPSPLPNFQQRNVQYFFGSSGQIPVHRKYKYTNKFCQQQFQFRGHKCRKVSTQLSFPPWKGPRNHHWSSGPLHTNLC